LAAPPHWRTDLSRFAAVIFDMDGVLVDGEPLHFRALNQLLAQEGRAVTLDEYRPYMGTKAGWAEFVADFGLAHPREHYEPLYHELVLKQYQSELSPLPGAVEAVHAARDAAGRVGLASSSARPWVETCLERIGLARAFDAIVTGTDIVHGKPSPEIYLLGAERLGVDPAQSLAIEDAPAGIAAAKAAGMECWAVLTEFTRDVELGLPDRVLPSLSALTVEDFRGVAA
jgi:HAD superfamily hydrolase (TIGR01509 family)